MKGGSVVERTFKVKNTGPKLVKLEWKLYNLGETEDVSSRKSSARNEQAAAVATANE